jgi:uncharacterized protein (DUF488 family)
MSEHTLAHENGKLARPPVYTIGYGTRRFDELCRLLERYDIEFLIDVRSIPFSRFAPDFSRPALVAALGAGRPRYVYMGDQLGGRPKDPACYTDGKVDYDKYCQKPEYLAGIARLLNAYEQGRSIAIMCSEARPEDCHRSKLIGESLVGRAATVAHISGQGDLLTQEEVIRSLTGGQPSLFGQPPAVTTSRRRYRGPDTGRDGA